MTADAPHGLSDMAIREISFSLRFATYTNLPEGCTKTDPGELPAGNGDPTIVVNCTVSLVALLLLTLVLMRRAATAFEFGSVT